MKKIKNILKKYWMSILFGIGSGLLYGGIVLYDCILNSYTKNVVIKATLTQFFASFTKTTISHGLITYTQRKAKTLFMKIIASYWLIPITLLFYGLSHYIAGTPEILQKLFKIFWIMIAYYTLLFIIHLYTEKRKKANLMQSNN